MPLAKDLLHPSPEEKWKYKKQHLAQSLNSYFMGVKCPGCYKITTVFSLAQTAVLCVGCSTVLCQPTGGKAKDLGCERRRVMTHQHAGGRAGHWAGESAVQPQQLQPKWDGSPGPR
uniref:40S ribosomal protein S27 n=1 Tax=Gopherus evgoodei TaxID=1825980 RepID=A0A8C4W6E1_9SAUR